MGLFIRLFLVPVVIFLVCVPSGATAQETHSQATSQTAAPRNPESPKQFESPTIPDPLDGNTAEKRKWLAAELSKVEVPEMLTDIQIEHFSMQQLRDLIAYLKFLNTDRDGFLLSNAESLTEFRKVKETSQIPSPEQLQALRDSWKLSREYFVGDDYPSIEIKKSPTSFMSHAARSGIVNIVESKFKDMFTKRRPFSSVNASNYAEWRRQSVGYTHTHWLSHEVPLSDQQLPSCRRDVMKAVTLTRVPWMEEEIKAATKLACTPEVLAKEAELRSQLISENSHAHFANDLNKVVADFNGFNSVVTELLKNGGIDPGCRASDVDLAICLVGMGPKRARARQLLQGLRNWTYDLTEITNYLRDGHHYFRHVAPEFAELQRYVGELTKAVEDFIEMIPAEFELVNLPAAPPSLRQASTKIPKARLVSTRPAADRVFMNGCPEDSGSGLEHCQYGGKDSHVPTLYYNPSHEVKYSYQPAPPGEVLTALGNAEASYRNYGSQLTGRYSADAAHHAATIESVKASMRAQIGQFVREAAFESPRSLVPEKDRKTLSDLLTMQRRQAATHDQIQKNLNASGADSGQRAAAMVADAASCISRSRGDFATADAYKQLATLLSVAKTGAEIALDLSPAGFAHSALQVITGRNIYGDEISSLARSLAMVDALTLGVVSEVKVGAVGLEKLAKAYRTANAVDSPAAQKEMVDIVDQAGAILRRVEVIKHEGITTETGRIILTPGAVRELELGTPREIYILSRALEGVSDEMAGQLFDSARKMKINNARISHIARGIQEGGWVRFMNANAEHYLKQDRMRGNMASDDVFVTTKAAADELVRITNGDPVEVARRLGMPTDKLENGLIRIDIPFRFEDLPQLPSGFEKSANKNFVRGGFTNGNFPEVILKAPRNSGTTVSRVPPLK